MRRLGSVIQGYFPGGLRAVAGRAAPVQRREMGRQSDRGAILLPPNLSQFAASAGRPLPDGVRQAMESFFGAKFGDVRIHVGAEASRLGALAFTRGSDIHFAHGQYDPATPRGRQILGHELAHVVQQRSGRVTNPFASGVAVVHDIGLEAEANRLAQRAAIQPLHGGGAIQRMYKVPQKKSGLDSDTQDQEGQIYGIWKNPNYPGVIDDSTLTSGDCLYIGKVSRGDDFGSRFVEHCRFDFGRPWADAKLHWDNQDPDKWPYVPRNVEKYSNFTKFDVAVLEQYFIEEYTITHQAKLLNKRNELTKTKFVLLENNPKVFTTKKLYKGWKPKDLI